MQKCIFCEEKRLDKLIRFPLGDGMMFRFINVCWKCYDEHEKETLLNKVRYAWYVVIRQTLVNKWSMDGKKIFLLSSPPKRNDNNSNESCHTAKVS